MMVVLLGLLAIDVLSEELSYILEIVERARQ